MGASFLSSLGITMVLLHVQQKQKRAKDRHRAEERIGIGSMVVGDAG